MPGIGVTAAKGSSKHQLMPVVSMRRISAEWSRTVEHQVGLKIENKITLRRKHEVRAEGSNLYYKWQFFATRFPLYSSAF
jgi:hypothetical protein